MYIMPCALKNYQKYLALFLTTFLDCVWFLLFKNVHVRLFPRSGAAGHMHGNQYVHFSYYRTIILHWQVTSFQCVFFFPPPAVRTFLDGTILPSYMWIYSLPLIFIIFLYAILLDTRRILKCYISTKVTGCETILYITNYIYI